MKKFITTALLAVSFVTLNAQIRTPKPSPSSKVEQEVGLTKVSIEYSRPGVKGRVIFGNLVPYGKVWRTGANYNTKVNFSTPITFNGTKIEQGEYALYTIPNKTEWEVILYKNTENWGNPKKWDDANVVSKTKVKISKITEAVETLSIGIDNITFDSAEMTISWQNTKVSVPFTTPAKVTTLANIKSTLSKDPSSENYYTSAVFLSSINQDLDKANEYMKKAMKETKEPKFWQLRQQALLLSKIGDKKKAIAIAKESLEKAKAAGNSDYVKLNTDAIAEWSKK